MAERAAEQLSGHDGHALGVRAAAVDVGAVDAHQGGGVGAQQRSGHGRGTHPLHCCPRTMQVKPRGGARPTVMARALCR
jgi:hypothetical protein